MQTLCSNLKQRGVRIIGCCYQLSPPTVKDLSKGLLACELGGAASVVKYVGLATEVEHASLVSVSDWVLILANLAAFVRLTSRERFPFRSMRVAWRTRKCPAFALLRARPAG